MQVTLSEVNIYTRFDVDEEIIKFRSSPNFKNMKKFLKSRNDLEAASMASCSTSPDTKPQQKVESKEEMKPVAVQPPLPPYPPPPDSPPALNVVIKKEKEEDIPDNPNINGDEIPEAVNQEQPAVNQEQPAVNQEQPAVNQEQPPPEAEQNEERPKKTICKEFVRGNCKRPVCKFAHVVDVSQLAGIFTFCWNYQNAICTYPNCRFVHASVFEEAEFYRTGSLPPHARSHLKKPLPAAAATEELQPDILPNFNNPPPSLQPDVEKPMAVISCIPASNLESRPPEDEFRVPVPCCTSPQKRDWNNADEFCSSPRDIEPNDHLAKKCKNCEFTEFRLQYHAAKARIMTQSSEEKIKKLAQLSKKSNQLCTVLLTLIKPPPAKPGITNGLAINGSGDKEKSILEKLNLIVNSKNISSVVNDDNARNTMLDTQHNFSLSDLMKLFCNTGDQTLSPETSREA